MTNPIAYRQGSSWILTTGPAKRREEQQLPYYIRRKQDVRDYVRRRCEDCRLPVTRITWA